MFDIGLRGAVVEPDVVVIGVRGKDGRRIVQSMPPGVVHIELQTVRQPLGQGHLHRIVITDAVGSQVANAAKLGMRSNGCARGKTVQLHRRGDDMGALVAHIADLQAQIGRKLLLDVEVPVLDVRSVPVPLHRAEGPHPREAGNVWEREAHQVGFLDPGQRNDRGPPGVDGRILHQRGIEVHVVDSVGAAHHRLARSER